MTLTEVLLLVVIALLAAIVLRPVVARVSNTVSQPVPVTTHGITSIVGTVALSQESNTVKTDPSCGPFGVLNTAANSLFVRDADGSQLFHKEVGVAIKPSQGGGWASFRVPSANV